MGCPLQKGGILESLIAKGLPIFPFFIQEKQKKIKKRYIHRFYILDSIKDLWRSLYEYGALITQKPGYLKQLITSRLFEYLEFVPRIHTFQLYAFLLLPFEPILLGSYGAFRGRF